MLVVVVIVIVTKTVVMVKSCGDKEMNLSDLKPTFLLDKESGDHLDKLMMIQHFVVGWIPYFKRRKKKITN